MITQVIIRGHFNVMQCLGTLTNFFVFVFLQSQWSVRVTQIYIRWLIFEWGYCSVEVHWVWTPRTTRQLSSYV